MSLKQEIAISYYQKIANHIRKTVLYLLHKTKSTHIACSYSIVEILVALYFRILNISAENLLRPERDRFILSKGHGCAAFYAVLTEKGLLKKEDLDAFAIDGGCLEHHPSINLNQGIEVSSGSLGHGLSIGVGMALATKRDNRGSKIYVLLGDGELNEGSVWEAAMFAPRHNLDNLVVMIDYNKMQAYGKTHEIVSLEPLRQKWLAFGWEVKEVDGHDFSQIFTAFDSLNFSDGKPKAIILHTTKGKGVSFMENNLLWHYRSPDADEYARALEELS